MSSEDQLSQVPSEDRAALREELQRAGDTERLRVFDALNRQSDGVDDDVPDMPEDLREKLLDRFGSSADEAAPAAQAPRTVSTEGKPGFFEGIAAFFRAKPIAGFGGLAVAACALMLVLVLPQLGGDGTGGGKGAGGKTDTIRGEVKPPATHSDVQIFFFPESKAAEVVALMSEDRKVILCEDVSDFAQKRQAEKVHWAVVVDLENRSISNIEAGKPTGDTAIDGDDAESVLLGIRDALNSMVNPQ